MNLKWIVLFTGFFVSSTAYDEYASNGGEYANPNGPFMHSARIFEDLDLKCSAIIIGPKIIMTVAHCVDSYISSSNLSTNYSRLSIVAGVSNSNIITSEVEEIKVLPEYLPRESQPALGDIALLKSKSRLYTEDLKPIFWPSVDHFDEQLNNPNCDLYSWGSISRDKQSYPDKLKRMLMHRVAHCTEIEDYCEECDLVSPQDENMLCGSVERSRGFICNGDAGGPIVHHDKTKITLLGLLIGEVLEKQSCGKEQFAVVSFVNIFHWKTQIARLAESLQHAEEEGDDNDYEADENPDDYLKSLSRSNTHNGFGGLYEVVVQVVVASVIVIILVLCVVLCSVYKNARSFGKLILRKTAGVMMSAGRRRTFDDEMYPFI